MGMTPSRRQIEAVTLADLAADGRMFVVRCALCKRQRAFLAADLLTVYSPSTPAYGMLRWCAVCGKSDWVKVTIRLPSHNDVGRLLIRKPDGVRTVQLWKDVWYEQGPDGR
jgi:hypothetical protein